MSDLLKRWSFPASNEEIPAARHYLRQICQGHYGYQESLGDVELIAGELLNNAVEHSKTPHVHVAVLAVDDATVRVEVCDDGTSVTIPQVQENGGERGGFGLLLVQALATKWDRELDQTSGRMKVWFEKTIT